MYIYIRLSSKNKRELIYIVGKNLKEYNFGKSVRCFLQSASNETAPRCPAAPQWARKFKKVRAKKVVKSNESKIFFRVIAFLAVLNFFPLEKLIFGHF